MRLSEDLVWMAPLVLVTITVLAAVVVGQLGSFQRPGLRKPIGLFAAGWIVITNLLMLVPGLHHVAAVLLAAGLAAQLTRVVMRSPDGSARLMRRSLPWVGGFLLVGGLVMRAQLQPARAVPETAVLRSGAPSVLLITLDTVRAANVSLYGYGRRTTPRLDQFAARGVAFDAAFSTAPWTLPSHASMFTGRWPHELSADFSSPLDAEYPTLAEYLGTRGYATAGFIGNLGYCSADTGLGRGFQHYEDYRVSPGALASSSTIVRTIANNFRLRRLIRNDQHLERISAEDLNRRALRWISAHTGSPFFVFLNYFDAHEPYLPPPPFDRQFGPGRLLGRHSPLNHWLWNPAANHANMGDAQRQEELDAYDGALAYLDLHVGAFLDELDRRRLLDNMVVLITSDHGEEFAEHGVYDHGYSLYRPGLQVPLVVVSPGRVPAGRRVTVTVSLRDLPATLVELTGLSESAPFPGSSLAGFWRDGPPDVIESSPVLSEVSRSPGQPDWFPSSRGGMKSIVVQGARYIRNGDGTEELYELHDSWERHNLAGAPGQATMLAAARAALGRVLGRTGAPAADK